jgi:lactate dehydrogenase-like 2-hydroxyacid dehydrogenase
LCCGSSPLDAYLQLGNDEVDRDTLKALASDRVSLIALRCAGYNNVDVEAAKNLGIKLVRVPAYSPYAVAEHTVGLILTLNRKLHRAYNRVREGNFSLEGLLGFDLHGRTILQGEAIAKANAPLPPTGLSVRAELAQSPLKL